MSKKYLLCSDLDRTLLPNGDQAESSEARPLLRALARHPELTLVYVSGRDKRLLLEAIEAYELPVPDYAIGDVGSTIYAISQGRWEPWSAWAEEIAQDWGGKEHAELAALFTDFEALRLQEPEKQNTFKLSYYAPEAIDPKTLLARMEERLAEANVRANLIWSIDEMAHTGLLDVLPKRANKLHAVHFLMEKQGFSEENTVFAGDSGNDLPVLTSGLQAILVRNASNEVRGEALSELQAKGLAHKLYIAQGGFRGMNGYYAAGVLEGLVHYLPEVKAWLTEVPKT